MMNILISTNSRYVMATIVMLESLFENNKETINIYMLYSNLSEDELNIINELVQIKFKSKLILLEVDKKLFKNAPVTSRFTEEIYYRLLAQDILPNSIDRVLYLDVDIIVNGSIVEFYNQSFDSNYLVACEGIGMSGKDFKTYENLNIPFDKKYFNSGVILYNLKTLRKNINTEVFFEYIKDKGDILTMPDQDVLNAMFYDNVKYCDYRIYNNGIIHIKNQNENIYARNNSCIIHYMGNLKPWNYKYTLYLDDLFWKYAKNTIYKKNYFSYKIKNNIYRILVKGKNVLQNSLK